MYIMIIAVSMGELLFPAATLLGDRVKNVQLIAINLII